MESFIFLSWLISIMGSILVYPNDKGLSEGTTAPNIHTRDIYNNEINLNKLLEENKGVLLDFFRGVW